MTRKIHADSDDFDVWIEAGQSDKHYWSELWHYRDLFLLLTWRNVAVRYKQTVAGTAWALLQPLLSLVILTVVFGKVAGLPSEGSAPYALMIIAGLLPWQFFSNALTSGTQSIVSNSSLISKVYFPRIIVPSSAILASLVDFFVSCLILVALMVWFAFWPGWRLLALPFLVLLAMLAAIGPCLILTALAVRYRDVGFVVPFIIQFGLYVSPVAYSSSLIREKFGEGAFLAYSLNPMVGVIDAFRWAVLGTDTLHGWGPGLSLTVAVVLLVWGVAYFRRAERAFADVI
jgi:lipopolysaccharide transport system permease protein